ncbi:unnamed protein product, partial [Rotaria sp. Silwood1]
ISTLVLVNSASSKFPKQSQDNEAFITQKYRRKKGTTKTSIQLDSSTKPNDVVPLASKQHINNNIHFDLSLQSHQHVSSTYDGYSSESDILSGRTFLEQQKIAIRIILA